MSRNKFIRYDAKLKLLARQLRKNSTLAEILLWMNIKNKSLGYEFHRQVPLDSYIVDFYCHELSLVIEVDGSSHDHNFEHDQIRQNRLEQLGVRIIRFSDEDVKKYMNDVLRSLLAVITEIEDGRMDQ